MQSSMAALMSRRREENFLLRNCWSQLGSGRNSKSSPTSFGAVFFRPPTDILSAYYVTFPPPKSCGFGNLCIFSFQPWELKLLGFIILWCSLVELQNGSVAFLASFDDRRHVTEYKLLFRKRYRCATSDVRYTVVTVAENGFGVERERCQHAQRNTPDLQGRQHN